MTASQHPTPPAIETMSRTALDSLYAEGCVLAVLQELLGLYTGGETMVEFGMEHTGIARISSGEIGKNSILVAGLELLDLTLFLYDEADGNALYATGRETRCDLLPEDR